MNPRIVTIIAGTIILALGLAGVSYPDRVMGLLGFSLLNPAHAAAALGEVRATYGGLFVVMGAFTLLAAVDPSAHRGRLTFIGCLWLGTCAGRLVSVNIDGNPGMPGWVAVALELLVGAALLAAAWVTPASSTPAPALSAAPASAPTPTPQP